MEIFISYTLRDATLTIEALYQIEEAMRSLGNPYIDIIHNTSINRQSHVISKLQQADVLCACVTPHFFESEWVRFELNLAIVLRTPIILFNHQVFSKKEICEINSIRQDINSLLIPSKTISTRQR